MHLTHSVRIALVVSGLVAGSIVTGVVPSSASSHAVGTDDGGTATYAEQPQAAPNFIFPFMGPAYFNSVNAGGFQDLMYRPLYFFGEGSTPYLNQKLSLAAPPVYSAGDRSAVVTLENYRWSNGEAVTADDVLFFMNMLHADKSNWGPYAPGTIPDNVISVRVDSPTRLTFTFDRSYNPTWMTYNQLSQITPIPRAWDVTAVGAKAGSGGCFGKPYGSADQACNAVFTFLSRQSGYDPSGNQGLARPPSTFAANPLWQVVDGPWRLTRLDDAGLVVMRPNPRYSGPVKPHLASFEEVPFVSQSSEYNALADGKIDVGYLPFDQASAIRPVHQSAPNDPRLAAHYRLDPRYAWGIFYIPYNFHSSGDGGNAGAIFSQLYFRQAFQSLIDQTLYAKKVFHGYAIPTTGPVPVFPRNSFSSALERHEQLYPFDPSHARSLLRSHGWSVVPGGTSTCARPGTGHDECGAGIPRGAALSFVLQYITGDASTDTMLAAEKASWSQAGIAVRLEGATSQTVYSAAQSCDPGPACTWELEDIGGWVYTPDVYPSGEELFLSGAVFNTGSYHDPAADSAIRSTLRSATPLTSYEDYMASQLPVVWEPTLPSQLTEVSHTLDGVLPQNPLLTLTPETWRFVSTADP